MGDPSWITKELFEDALRNFYKEKSIDIKGYCSEAAVPPGDNYTSYLYRVTVSYTTGDDCEINQIKTISTLVKSKPTDGGPMEALSNEMDLFPIEIKMFGDTLKKLHKILGGEEILSAQCLLTIIEPPLLVLEDLKPLGYKMVPRQLGLDLDHCTMVLQKLAKFHAASIVMIKEDPKSKDLFKDGIYYDSELIKAWIRAGFESVIDAAKKWPSCQKYARKLETLGEKAMMDRGIKASERNLNEFNVLNHGDCWTNNLMFTYYSNGVLKDTRFVDFQLVTYKSPMIDLHYFIATSPSVEVRTNHLDTLLTIYHTTLTIELGKLKYDLKNVPTRTELQKIFEDKAFYGMVSASTVLPIVRADSRPDASFNNLMKENTPGSFRHHCYSNERFRDMMEYQLKYYDDLGIFN